MSLTQIFKRVYFAARNTHAFLAPYRSEGIGIDSLDDMIRQLWQLTMPACVRLRTMLAAACFLAAGFPIQAADIFYAYDPAGRLIQVQTAAGAGQYRYDTAGNLIAINRPASNTVSIVGFAPETGPVDTLVTVTGSGFSTTAAANQVSFNGKPASVTGATTTSLTVRVPAGATTGKITVTVAGNSAQSAEVFTVAALPSQGGLSVSGVSHTIATIGTQVTLTGKGFVGSSGNDLWVRVNGVDAQIVSASETQIVFTVPANISSGYVSVGTRYGSIVAPSLLFIPSLYINPVDIGATSIHTIDGLSEIVNVPAGKMGLIAFSGETGQRLGLGVSAFATAPSGGRFDMHIVNPDGSTLVTCFYDQAAPGGECDLPALPVTGTYTVIVDPAGTYAATFTLTLSSDLTRRLTVNGSVATFNTSRVGQNGRYTFSGTQGSRYSLVWTGAGFSDRYFYLDVVDTNDARVDTNTGVIGAQPGSNSSGSVSISSLPVDGDYTIVIDPWGVGLGQVSLALVADLTDTIQIDGPEKNVNLAVGQYGHIRFDGRAGQNISLGISRLSTNPADYGVTVEVFGPDSERMRYCGPTSSSGGKCSMTLPSDGGYVIDLEPRAHSTSLTLTLSSDLTGTLAVNGAAQTFSTNRAGQNGRYFFTALAGGNYQLAWSDVSNLDYSDITVFRPDGYTQAGVGFSSSYHPSGVLNLNNLVFDGTYTILLSQPTTGRVNLRITGDKVAEPPSGGNNGDAPIPLWASLLLGASLWRVLKRQSSRHARTFQNSRNPL